MKKYKPLKKWILLGAFVVSIAICIHYYRNSKVTHYCVYSQVALSYVAPRYFTMSSYADDPRIVIIKGTGFSISIQRNTFLSQQKNDSYNPRAQGEIVLEIPQKFPKEQLENLTENDYDVLLSKLGYFRVTSGKKRDLFGKKIYRKGQIYFTPDKKNKYILYPDIPIIESQNKYESLIITLGYSDINDRSIEKSADDIIMSIEDISVYLKNKSK